MKKYFLQVAIFFSIVSCTSGKKTNTSTLTKEEQSKSSKTFGKISHQYKSTGCSTVIIVEGSVLNAPLVLIPKDKLDNEINKDGQ